MKRHDCPFSPSISAITAIRMINHVGAVELGLCGHFGRGVWRIPSSPSSPSATLLVDSSNRAVIFILEAGGRYSFVPAVVELSAVESDALLRPNSRTADRTLVAVWQRATST